MVTKSLLKIWRGDVAHPEALEQLKKYLDAKRAKNGYLLTFDLRETKSEEEMGWKGWKDWNGKKIFDVVVV